MAPLFLFLTSSLNVELVYVILYGISQFSLLNLINKSNEGLTKEQRKRFQAMEYNVDQFGSTTITIRSFKIHNIQSWQEKSGKEFFDSDTIGIGEEDVEESKEED